MLWEHEVASSSLAVPTNVKKIIILSLFIFLLFLIAQVLLPKTINIPFPSLKSNPSVTSNPPNPSPPETVKVKRVVDGDTIELDNGKKVRYIGIDTPELKDPRKPVQCFAKEASDKNKELVEGKTVRLEKDVSDTDKFDRLLRYVYVVDNDLTFSALFVNEYLVKEGYAYASTFPPDVKYADLFLKAQTKAREQNKGLWKECNN
ncbi:MAG: thermonuclease family protein [Candidatus Roizmanbacteria bacterium]|nr:MAG: thermonuclease family protein [Candidatus Roizmanbacteria bacterium]